MYRHAFSDDDWRVLWGCAIIDGRPDELQGITNEELRFLVCRIDASSKRLGLFDLGDWEGKLVHRKTAGEWEHNAGYFLQMWEPERNPFKIKDHPANPDGPFLGKTKREAYMCLMKILGGLVLCQSKAVEKHYYHWRA